MSKQTEPKRNSGGKQLSDVRGSVAENTAKAEAGRERKRAERRAREAARTKERETSEVVALSRIVDEANRQQSRSVDEANRERIKQTIDYIEIAMDCESILKGVEGDYHLFGLALKVHSHKGASGPHMVLEVIYVLPEADISKMVHPGLYLPITTLRMDPRRVDWRSNSQKAFAEYLHTQKFGTIARTHRRQHFAEAKAMAEKAKTPVTASRTAPYIGRAILEQCVAVNDMFLLSAGLWKMPDGVVVKTWHNPRGAHCASVRSVPHPTHPLANYTFFIKTAHLPLNENGMEGSELRNYLRTHVPKLAEAA